jgi:hypothetical protein
MKKGTTMKSILFLTLLAALAANDLAAQDGRSSSVLQPGEELQYKVRWNFLRLGTLTVRTEQLTDGRDSGKICVSMNVESNPSIPFVDIHEYSATIIDGETRMSRRYAADWHNGKDQTEILAEYDRARGTVYYVQLHRPDSSLDRIDTLRNIAPFVDGPSLFMFTRWISQRVGTTNVPTMIDGTIQNTRLEFPGTVEEVEVAGIDYPVPCRKYSGTAEWQGGSSAGLSGSFTGWLSNDCASVVLMGKMKVLLGSITLELEYWQRPGWIPPTAQKYATH